MDAFWSVAKGSDEPPRMLELIWDSKNSKNDKTFCLVGKGVTFDSGGISIKERFITKNMSRTYVTFL